MDQAQGADDQQGSPGQPSNKGSDQLNSGQDQPPSGGGDHQHPHLDQSQQRNSDQQAHLDQAEGAGDRRGMESSTKERLGGPEKASKGTQGKGETTKSPECKSPKCHQSHGRLRHWSNCRERSSSSEDIENLLNSSNIGDNSHCHPDSSSGSLEYKEIETEPKLTDQLESISDDALDLNYTQNHEDKARPTMRTRDQANWKARSRERTRQWSNNKKRTRLENATRKRTPEARGQAVQGDTHWGQIPVFQPGTL